MALTDNIIGAWTFDASSLADFFAAGATLTQTGTPVNFAGHIGDAWAFGTYQASGGGARLLGTGVDAFSFRLSGGPVLGTSKTITFWAYAVSWAGQPGIISNWANAGGGPVQWLCYADDATHISFQVRESGGTDRIARIVAPSTGAWHFYCLRYDSATGVCSIAVDNGAFTSATANASVIEGIGSLEVGSRNNGAAVLNGAVDAMTWHDRILTTEEITFLYNAGAGDQPPWDAPTAAFSGTPLSGIAPLTVDFTDESTGNPSSWAWDFGDSETSTDQNPSHEYTDPGTYTVELEATNAAGSDTETKVAYITVSAASSEDDDLCSTDDWRPRR